MLKKFMTLLLITIMFSSTSITISATNDQSVISTFFQEDNLISDYYDTVYPGTNVFDGISVSVSERYYRIYREENGDVTLRIEEIFNTTACRYEFMATDAEGLHFIPSYNQTFYVEKQGDFVITFPASSVSVDGYIYLKFAINPNRNPNILLAERCFRIPVDYGTHKINEDDYLNMEPQQNQHITGMNGQYMDLSASATRRNNGNVFVQLDIKDTNVSSTFEHRATSRAGDIYLPHNNSTFIASEGKTMTVSLYKYNVSVEGYVYFNIMFTSPNGETYVVEQIKIPIA